MIVTSKIVSGLALATLIALAASSPANAGSCGRYGGWGIGVTKDIAMFMSNKATHQALDKDNAKPIAAIRTECNNNAVLYVQCHSFTKGCAH